MTRVPLRLPCTIAGLLALLSLAACSATIEQVGTHRVRLFSGSVKLHGHALPLHLGSGFGGQTPLLVYATGDAGWLGHDVALYNRLVTSGYPVVGFSARFYLSHLRNGRSQETPGDLAADYAAIADTALALLHLPRQTPLVLVGKSRGADLAVIAASVASLRPRVAGVLAVALTAEEEYVSTRAGEPLPQPDMVHPYELLPELTGMPAMVIQSTSDQYLPAEQARRLFGPDTNDRRLLPITAEDHNFDGALDELYDDLARGLQWVVETSAARRGRSARAIPPLH